MAINSANSVKPIEPQQPFSVLVGQLANLTDHLDSTLLRARQATDRIGFSFYGSDVAPSVSFLAQLEKEIDNGGSYIAALQTVLNVLEDRADGLRAFITCLETQVPEPIMAAVQMPKRIVEGETISAVLGHR